MPFTFLAHQAPVLPLKVLAPGWFDGTALAVGSMAPDLVYVLGGTPFAVDAHGWTAQVTVCLPLTLVLTVLIKRFCIPAVAPLLPDAGPFHLRDFARVARWRMTSGALAVAAVSAVVGSVSHVVLDAFTHGDGWGVRLVPWLRTPVVVLPAGIPGRFVNVFDVLQLGGSVIGAVATTAVVLSIGRRRLLTHWYPDPSPPVAAPTGAADRRFRAGLVLALGVLLLLLAAAVAGRAGGVQHLVVRVTAALVVGAVLAGALARTDGTSGPSRPREGRP